MPSPKTPKTTPECESLQTIVMEGLNSNPFEAQKKEAARAALKRMRKNRCMKSLEYIIQVACNSNPLDFFAREICQKATEYLK